MSASTTLECGVPAPLQFEAVSSWISRLALAQGCSLRSIRRFLEVPSRVDVDMFVVGDRLQALRRKCALGPQAFSIAGAVIDNLEAWGLEGEMLLTNRFGLPLFRFCPPCLGECKTGAIAIHWRFEDWRDEPGVLSPTLARFVGAVKRLSMPS